MNELADIHDFPDDVLEDNATVNGWVLDNLGKVPEVGDSFEYDNLSVEVTETDGRRASQIKVIINPIPEEDEDDDDGDQKEKHADESDGEEAEEKASRSRLHA